MGAIADAFAAFAQPLIDETDGSPEQVQKALHLSQLCYNAALLSAGEREELWAECQSSLGMNDEEFGDLRRSVLDPMIARHEEMFPPLNDWLRSLPSAVGPSSWLGPRSPASEAGAAAATKKSTVERYAPCPCGSGKKYKFCCGATR